MPKGDCYAQTNVLEMLLSITFPHLISKPGPNAKSLLGAQGAAETFGWDTVFAIPASSMNSALQKPGACPTTFTYSESATWYGSGNFGAWQVTLGGGGADLNMTVPITTGSLTYDVNTYPLDGPVVSIQIKLQYVPQPPSANGTPNNLVPSTTSAVDVLDMSFGTVPPSNIKWLAMGLMSDYFNNNLADFTYVFNTVNLNMTADQSQFQWLKPTDVSYAYVDGGTLDEATFGVLCMTMNDSGSGLPQEISENAIPTGQSAGFLISAGKYLNQLLLPGMPALFQNASVSDFAVDYSANSLSNINPLNMTDVSLSTGTYTPQVAAGNCMVTIAGDQIVLTMTDVTVDYSPGISIVMTYTAYSNLVLTTNSSGQQVITMQQAAPPTTTHSVNVASWVIWTEVIAGIVAGIITAFVGGASKAVFQAVVYRVIATIIAALILGTIAAIGGIIQALAEGNSDALP